MWRLVAIAFMLLGAAVAGIAVSNEIDGTVTYHSKARVYPVTYSREHNPEEYRNLLNVYWVVAGVLFLSGYVSLALVRGSEKTDPFRARP